MSLRDQNNINDAFKTFRQDLPPEFYLNKLLLKLVSDLGCATNEISGDDKWRQQMMIAALYGSRTINKPHVYTNVHVKNMAKFKDGLENVLAELLAMAATISDIEKEPYL